jgi:DNA-binding NarL/FixJ family response regulator
MAAELRPAIRVMLVDDHAVVREGYRRLLALEPDMRVVAESADADGAFTALQRQPDLADVMVLDLSMPGRSGLDLLQRVAAHWPRLRVLVFSMHDNPAMVTQALRAGAMGYITKSSPPDELVNAVRCAAQGRLVLSADVAQVALAGQPNALHTGLSTREFDVLRFLLEGQTLEQIAERLHLSAKTVANYQTLIRQRLGVSNAVELLRYARQHGLSA